MLRRTLVRSAQEARRPLIRFPDRKPASTQSQHDEHTPHPHPAAPDAVANDFEHFQQVYSSGPHFYPEKIQQASSSGGQTNAPASGKSAGGQEVAEDVHDLPRRFWATPALAFEEKEMDAIMSGGATLIQPK